MKTEGDIRTEIERRINFKNSKSYSNYRANNTFIKALMWVLEVDYGQFTLRGKIERIKKIIDKIPDDEI